MSSQTVDASVDARIARLEELVDHEAIVDVLVDAGYNGYISSEWEGTPTPTTSAAGTWCAATTTCWRA